MPSKKRQISTKGRNWKGRKNKYQFKSKFESRISDELKDLGIDSNYESLTLEYIQTRKYNPDFRLKGPNGEIIVEAKGLFDAEDRRKHLSVKEQHPQHDIRFVFYANQKLRKGAKSTYGEWCDRHGFKWAVKNIPKEWLQEIGLLPTEK